MTVAEKRAVRQYPHGGRRARCVRRREGWVASPWNSGTRSSLQEAQYFGQHRLSVELFTKHYAKNLETWIILSKAQQSKDLSAFVTLNASKAPVSKRLSYKTRQ